MLGYDTDNLPERDFGGAIMTEAWKQWEGQVVEGRFSLRQYLGGSEHEAVFLTECSGPEPQKAAIKLVRAGSSDAENQLSLWQLAAKLSHPNLLKLFHSGSCRVADSDLLFVVMEFADEDLSQILPERPLTPNEVRDMLEPVLDALVYLHSKGFVHAHVKPTNILAAGDRLKLSIDGVCRADAPSPELVRPSPYHAPEAANGVTSPAGDAWALGMTLVEALTQHLPSWQPEQKADPVVPKSLPAPFLEIAHNSLRRDPKRRWTVGDIAARLNPSSAAAAAASASKSAPSPAPAAVSRLPGAAVDPLSVPLSPVPPGRGARDLPGLLEPHDPMARWKQTPKKSRSLVPAVAITVALVAILIVPKLLNHSPESRTAPSVASAQQAVEQTPPQTVQPPVKLKTQPKLEQRTATREAKSPSLQPAPIPDESSLKATTEKQRASLGEASLPTAAESQPVAKASPIAANGEVLDQVLPDVSEKARQTIKGKVRVSVRVHVDPSGNVTQAELDTPTASRYFADLALQAARRWEFSSPELDGHSVASEWVLRFEFTPTDTKASSHQVTH